MLMIDSLFGLVDGKRWGEWGRFLNRLISFDQNIKSAMEKTITCPAFRVIFTRHLLDLWTMKFTANSRIWTYIFSAAPTTLFQISAIIFAYSVVSGLLTAMTASISWIFSRTATETSRSDGLLTIYEGRSSPRQLLCAVRKHEMCNLATDMNCMSSSRWGFWMVGAVYYLTLKTEVTEYSRTSQLE